MLNTGMSKADAKECYGLYNKYNLQRVVAGYNYGIILILKGLIDFIQELNEIIAHDTINKEGHGRRNLRDNLRNSLTYYQKQFRNSFC
uniref:Uncharacterized protein n=1 Tax=Lactuca sativa TaxID=4236 RepID=A0A9R1X9Q6_LACSA|nr:hypothetical protein LSAT_V11C500269700 [Lactuca sativa]